jgi:hypothetical protein
MPDPTPFPSFHSSTPVDRPWTQASIEDEASRIREHLYNRFSDIGSIMPGFFVFATLHPRTYEPHRNVVPVLFENTEEAGDEVKDRTSVVVSTLAKELHAQAVLFVSEVWCAYYPPGTKDADMGRPSKSPQRREALLCSLETTTRSQSRSWVCFIDRDEAGRATLGGWNDLPPTKVDGRFSNLLEHGS